MKQPQYRGNKSLSDLNVICALFQLSEDISTLSFEVVGPDTWQMVIGKDPSSVSSNAQTT